VADRSIPRCLLCARPLRLQHDGSRGYDGDGLFCSLRCGYRWAREYAAAMIQVGVITR
jgi:hypothetical protein